MDNKLHILQHSLGLDEYGRGKPYRNYFVTGEGSRDFPTCKELVSLGLMTERTGDPYLGGDSVFYVTPQGIEFVKLNSPSPPKLTRSQKRYRDWLDADCNMKFGEWLRAAR